MAKFQAKAQGDGPEDGLREKMIAVNRVTKVVKGGRILAFAALTVVGDGDGKVGMGKGNRKRCPLLFKKPWKKRVATCTKCRLKTAPSITPFTVTTVQRAFSWRPLPRVLASLPAAPCVLFSK